MITAVVLILFGVFAYGILVIKNVLKDNQEFKSRETENEAATIVKSKTAGQLVDDFNKRYASKSDDGNNSPPKKG